MNRLDQNAEPLDSLLGAYFRAEMPTPWPSFDRRETTVLPPRPETARPTSWWAMYSRFALALSVALLLGGAWFLGGMSAPLLQKSGLSDNELGPGGAGRGKTFLHTDDAKKVKNNKEKAPDDKAGANEQDPPEIGK